MDLDWAIGILLGKGELEQTHRAGFDPVTMNAEIRVVHLQARVTKDLLQPPEEDSGGAFQSLLRQRDPPHSGSYSSFQWQSGFYCPESPAGGNLSQQSFLTSAPGAVGRAELKRQPEGRTAPL